MVESDHTEERLARVERMLARYRKEASALKVIAASKVRVIVVEAATPPPLRTRRAARLAERR